ncbi:hypothetical protein ACTFIY_010898 [Dictyostelium cf. discoideum]
MNKNEEIKKTIKNEEEDVNNDNDDNDDNDDDDIEFVGLHHIGDNNNTSTNNDMTKSYDASDGGLFLDDLSQSDIQFNDQKRHDSDSELQVQKLLNEREQQQQQQQQQHQQDNDFGDRMFDDDIDENNDRQEIIDSNNIYHSNLKGYNHSDNIKLPTFSGSSNNSNNNNTNNNNNKNNDVDYDVDGDPIPSIEGINKINKLGIADDLNNYGLDEYMDVPPSSSSFNKINTTTTTTTTTTATTTTTETTSISSQNDNYQIIDSKYDPKTTNLFNTPIALNKIMIFIKGVVMYRCRFLQSTLSKPIDLKNESEQKRVQELAFVLLEQKGNIQFIKNDRFILSLRIHSKNSYNDKFVISNQRDEPMKFCRNKFTFIIQRL